MAGTESLPYRTAGSVPQMLPYNASLGGFKGRKVPKNSSFMRNANKPKTPQQASSKPTLSNAAYYMALVEPAELIGIVPHDHPGLKGFSPTVLKENILAKAKPDSPANRAATSPPAAPKAGVDVGLQQRSMSQDPTVTGPENRSQTPQSLHAPASPTEAETKLQFFNYDKETLIVSANQQMLAPDNSRKASGQHPLKPQKRQMSHNPTSEAMSSNQDRTDDNIRGEGQSDVGSNNEHGYERDNCGQHEQKRRPKQKSLAETTSNAEHDKSNGDLQSPGISTVNAATSHADIQSNRFSPKHQQLFKENRESSNTQGAQSPVLVMSNDFGILNYPPPQMEAQRVTIGSGGSSNRNLASHK